MTLDTRSPTNGGAPEASDPVTIDIAVAPTPDTPTVSATGERLQTQIEGVRIRPAIVQSDERGSITELMNPDWDFTDEPLVYVYQTTVRPGKKKGWIVHFEQDDRLFFDDGTAKVALYDARTGSPTYGVVNVLFLGDANRGLLRIPAGVFHGVVNVGEHDLRFINCPTRPYRHDRPDKARLPADTDAIPYKL